MEKYVNIVIYAPLTHSEDIRTVLGKMGAGKIGAYTFCSFTIRGTGRFKPDESANPHIGKRNELEQVEEDRIECICNKEILKDVIQSIKSVHPYEEPVILIQPLLSYD